MIIARPFGRRSWRVPNHQGSMTMSQCRVARVLMARRTTLVGITASEDESVLLIPVVSGSFHGPFPVSISRLGQAFEHRLDAQARTGLRCGLKRFKLGRSSQPCAVRALSLIGGS